MPKRKFYDGDRVEVNDRKASFWGRQGTVVDYKRGEYCTQFDDGRTEWVDSRWLDRVDSQ